MKESELFNVASLIITHNPDEGLINLVSTIQSQVESIIIVDNFSDYKSMKILNLIEKQYKITLIKNNQNLGIAKALNQGVIEAKKHDVNYVLTFDQDSTPFDNIVSIIKEVYDSYLYKDKIGAIGVNYTSSIQDSYNEGSNQKLYLEKDYLITSGCMISLQSFFHIGGFREDFFIDNVDLEYSLRLKKNGYKLLISQKPGMIHKAGNPLIKFFLGFKITSSNHNSFRRYYMSRNHILLTKDYFFIEPYFVLKCNYFYILSILKIIMVEKDVMLKLKKSYEGILDAFNYQSIKMHTNQ
ncbi:glycosyltransferase family 2 protein [Chitinophagaceae bacterium LB-8]|uniref:Glycosyltransferase family 2 protein n=1 Tax=Paraflavisolibacter caeni TaxID=2982496 RepID=A0A9X2XSU0_9BACT|nr:glycosyltransferase family 2 protein [Paraflavisolibacter caeni]MCU7548494.1 glycosyltransferase family 2 protein [Paraflavisolibacter caeni]